MRLGLPLLAGLRGARAAAEGLARVCGGGLCVGWGFWGARRRRRGARRGLGGGAGRWWRAPCVAAGRSRAARAGGNTRRGRRPLEASGWGGVVSRRAFRGRGRSMPRAARRGALPLSAPASVACGAAAAPAPAAAGPVAPGLPPRNAVNGAGDTWRAACALEARGAWQQWLGADEYALFRPLLGSQRYARTLAAPGTSSRIEAPLSYVGLASWPIATAPTGPRPKT